MVKHWANEHGFGGGVQSEESDEYALKDRYGSHAVLLDWLGRHPQARVLDAGCYDGRFAQRARVLGHHVTGLDRQKHEGVADRVDEFIEADLNLPLPHGLDALYDVVIAGDILEHVVEPHLLLADLATKVRPGGELLVSVPNFGHWYPRGRIAIGRFDYDQRGPLDRGHIRFFTRDMIERLLADAGLRILETPHRRHPVQHLRGLLAGQPGWSRGQAHRAHRPRAGPRLAADVRLSVPLPAGSGVTSTVLTRPTTPSQPPNADRSAVIRLVATATGLLVGGLGYFLTLLNYVDRHHAYGAGRRILLELLRRPGPRDPRRPPRHGPGSPSRSRVSSTTA